MTGDGIDEIIAWTEGLNQAFVYTVADLPDSTASFATNFDSCSFDNLPPRQYVGVLAIADADGDGNGDYIGLGCSNGDPDENGSIQVRLGDGTGAVGDAVETTFTGRPYEMSVGDLNGDDKADVAVVVNICEDMACANKLNDVYVLLAGDGGSYGDATKVASAAKEIELVDLNGDDVLDLIKPEEFLPGNGDGTFGDAIANTMDRDDTVGFGIGDINDDDIPDVVQADMGGSLRLWFNDGTGALTEDQNIALGAPGSVGVADVNSDGIDDMLMVNNASSIVQFVLSTGTVETQNSGTKSIAIGEFNGDGVPDAVVTGGAASVLSFHFSNP
jgi:hypothetical protein